MPFLLKFLSFSAKHISQGIDGKNCSQLFFILLSLLFCPLPLDIPFSLLLLLQTPNHIGIDKFVIDIECLSSEGTAKDANGIQDEPRSNFDEGGGGGLSSEFSLGLGFFGGGGGLFEYLIVSYPNLRIMRWLDEESKQLQMSIELLRQ